MKPTLSVIVPVLNERLRLPALLRRMLSWGPGIELIAVDGGSRDGSWEWLSTQAQVRALRSAPGRAQQLNLGAMAARAPLLLFLHADTLPPSDAPLQIGKALADARVSAGSFRLEFDSPQPLLRFYAWCSRANILLTTFGDQGLFLRRTTFLDIGGFAVLPFLEDIEIQKRLRAQGRFVKLDAAVVTSARRFQRYGLLRQQLRNIAIVVAYLLGGSPSKLKRYYADTR
jgi:rSAM/selenodomain-associated transferase 2